MDCQNQNIKDIVSSSFESCLQKVKTNSKSFQQPSPRIFHTCVSHKSYLYVYGGLPLNPSDQFLNQHQFIYRYDVHRFEWKKIQLNFPNNFGNGYNPLKNIYSHSCVIYGNMMYLFGGKNGKNGNCLNELWAMNLDSFNWKKQDQKGLIPERRQAASMVLVNRSNIFLYGGKNQDYIFNDVNIYKIESKQWHSIDTKSLQFQMPKRIRPAICVQNDQIFIYGGEREFSIEDEFEVLNDFYQIKIVQKSTSLKPDIWVKRILTFLQPKDLTSPRLFTINDRYLGLIGGKNNQGRIKIWVYDQQRVRWNFSIVQDPIKSQLGFGYSATYHYERVYLYGGLKSNQSPSTIFISIHIDSSQIINNSNKNNYLVQKSQVNVNTAELNKYCYSCRELKYSLCWKRMESFEMFTAALKEIKYPFNAFGLLIDNSNLIKSTNINISCLSVNLKDNLNNLNNKCIIIEDDAEADKLWMNQQEFLDDMINFRTICEEEMEVEGDEIDQNQMQQNMDQKIQIQQTPLQIKPINGQNLMGTPKKQQEKQQEKLLKRKKQIAKKNKARLLRKRKQFSLNLKLGAMRLAKKMIYISNVSNGSKRVFFLEQVESHSIDLQSNKNTAQVHYQCYYFSYPSQTNSDFTSPLSSEFSKNLIENTYKDYLKLIDQQSQTMKNSLILIGLREIQTEDNTKQFQLKINPKMNDILYGSNKQISKAQSQNILIQDCIDISLKCYISLLYLKGQYAKVSISVSGDDKFQEISNAHYFQKIDNLACSNIITDLQAAFDLEQCKIVELYYHKPLNNKIKSDKQKKQTKSGSNKQLSGSLSNVFINGILIYHKNRLIKRYKYALGQLLKNNDIKKITSKYLNPLKIFGFIELDEVFYSNIFKTNIVNEELLDNMFGRIIFVQNYLQNKTYQSSLNNTNIHSQKRSLYKRNNPNKEDQNSEQNSHAVQNKKRIKIE